MVFSSIPFLYYFLPCVLLVYLAVPKALKNTVLLLFSLLFYAWGEPVYVFLMFATIIVNYFLAILIEKAKGNGAKKTYMFFAALFSLGCLAYFKYANFFLANVHYVTGVSLGLLKVALPIGISFYTFQVLSYTIDVYRGDVKAQKNPITLATYVTLFPQLIAGPIVRYIDVEQQLISRTHSFEKISQGIRRFIIGLSKKVLLANTLGELCEGFHAADEKSILFYWLFVAAYMLQVYFDFSGYSDMAIGLGKLFGFDFLENFRYPFISRSISEFWRRWHISLGSWFRDYVYIPMGGNRVKKGRLLFNLFTVWLLTGLWHGAEWNFVVWGLYFGALLTLEKFFLGKYIEKSKAFGHVYVLILTAISFAIFSADSMQHAVSNICGMFGVGGIPFFSNIFIYHIRSFWFVIVISMIAATPIPKILLAKVCKNKAFSAIWNWVEIPILLALLALCTAYLADGAFNPFLYFRF